MKKITLFKRAFWILGLTALTVLFLACENELQFEKLWNDTGKVAVSFTVTDGAARTVLPSQDNLSLVDHYTLLGGKNGATETVLVDSFSGSTTVTLDPGMWNFTLNAYNADDVHMLQGKVQGKLVSSQGNNNVSFTMSGLKSGTGSIHVTFNFPTTAGITQISVKGDLTPENFSSFTNGNFVYTKTDVDAEDYFINFEFYSGDKLRTVISELVLVRNGLTSARTITLLGEDLKPMLTGTVSISGKPESGQILMANTVLEGTGTINYQWNKDGTAISGSVGSIYLVQPEDIGSTITVTVTRIGYPGSITSEPTATIVASVSPIITLTENTWADGNLPTSSDEQWFKFIATASTQYIHAAFVTLNYLYVQVYDSSGAAVESESNLNTSSTKFSRTVTVGQVYYIRVRPYSTNSGTYQIGFNTGGIPPGITVIPLTLNTWADGNLPTSSDVQWFKFTATASTQYIHAAFGTLNSSSGGIYVQLYNLSGTTVGSENRLNSSNRYVSRTVTIGQEYYIMVRPSNSTYSGTYKIGFTTNFVPPDVITLTLNTWADGNLPTSSDEQWFKFTATASTQYIHAAFGTLGNLNVQLYDSRGLTVGSETNLSVSGIKRSFSQTVTVGQVYYIRVSPSGSGTYQIGFNATFYPPSVTLLTLNTWEDGNLTTNGEQWFKFTATATMQYIHVSFGTLTALKLQVNTSSGDMVEPEFGWTALSGSNTGIVTVRNVTVSQEYYIRVQPYDSSPSSGTYRIGFNTGGIPPDITAITLTENAWGNGNIPTSRDTQWFKFTATADTQYIHASFGTLTDLYVWLYTSSGTTVGSSTELVSSTIYISRTVTIGQEYYIRVRPYSGSGTYKIGFTTSTTPPPN